MSCLPFPFSDTIAGYVTRYERAADTVEVRTSGGCAYTVKLKPNTYAQLMRNLGEPYQDATGQMREMLEPGRFVYAYAIFYPEGDGFTIEAQSLLFTGRRTDEYGFEKRTWWVDQIEQLAEFYLRAQFADAEIDFRDYRTSLRLTGEKALDNFRQETDTVSRLVYGLASAYMLTGRDRFLEAAERGTEYLREHMRFFDADEGIVYWYHGIDVHGSREDKVFASEFGDDYDAIPAYEQIYALAGPVQTYRVTGDPRILRDAELTVELFDRFFLDREKGGYFSHLDPVTLDPRSEALGENRAKKNWNSVGDHAPAYLINLALATGAERYERMLETTFDTITERFQDYDNSPFVQEKFLEDWSPDRTHMWQQDRGVVGHNLKIAWNLMRMHSLRPKPEYESFARRIAELMPRIGGDPQRGGWYDVMERQRGDDQAWHRFAFHDRKAWWQQEQGILAYLILAGVLGGDEYLRQARESASFYNSFFLDHDDGAIFFNVLASGMAYLSGTERFKGSHSMSMYHTGELCYLAAVYTNLLVTRQTLDLHFKPYPNGFEGRLLRVQPDLLPPGRVRIREVWVDDEPYGEFDPERLLVTLPESDERHRVRVRLEASGG